MMISQCPSRSTPLRMARKISPSDQWLNCPAGVRLEDTNDPIGIGRSLATSRPPVSVPVLEWQPLQKPSEIAWQNLFGRDGDLQVKGWSAASMKFEQPDNHDHAYHRDSGRE